MDTPAEQKPPEEKRMTSGDAVAAMLIAIVNSLNDTIEKFEQDALNLQGIPLENSRTGIRAAKFLRKGFMQQVVELQKTASPIIRAH